MTTLKTAPSFHKQLESNLKIYARKTSQNINRIRKKVAFERLMARLAIEQPSSFFLKGGYAMELRINNARATKDIDLTFFQKGARAFSFTQELERLSQIDLKDHFIYQIGKPQSDIENAPYGGSRHQVKVLIDQIPFVEFHLDLGGDILINDVEHVHGTHWLEFCKIEPPIIPMISVEQQFAEKLHTYTQTPSRFGILALPKPRDSTIVNRSIFLILTGLRSLNRESFGFAKNLILREFVYTHCLVHKSIPERKILSTYFYF